MVFIGRGPISCHLGLPPSLGGPMCDHTHPGGLGPMSNRGNAQSLVCCARGPMSMDALVSVTSSEKWKMELEGEVNVHGFIPGPSPDGC